ncbi:MAG TPA: hypothetical protein DIT64_08205 [Verrucomicrobiales bacterium]|nr:hypothetical protein [Verrucomicrobiales bacterium]
MKASSWMPVFLLVSTLPSAGADALEDLLMPRVEASKLSDERANAAWRMVVEAFHRNDMEKAVELGKAFMSSDLKTSAYQLLGVKVMLGLAGGADSGSMFVSRADNEEKKKLEEERASITERYQELATIYRDADARINLLTSNRTRPVQQGSTNHLECLRCARLMEDAKSGMDALKRPVEENKKKMARLEEKAKSGMKPQTLELLDMLIAADEIEAAFAIANTYIRTAGNDLDIARKQQDVVRLREVGDKAAKVMALLQEEIKDLVAGKKYWEAWAKTGQFLDRVGQLNHDEELLKMVRSRTALDPLGVRKKMIEGEESHRLIKQHAAVDFTRAWQDFVVFESAYPDHPGRKELELHIATAKARSLDAILSQLDFDFQDVQRRFNPAKLSAYATETASGGGAAAASSSQKLLDLGLAPADVRLVHSKLQGMNAAVGMVEKIGVPQDRMVRLTEIKTTLAALATLLQ